MISRKTFDLIAKLIVKYKLPPEFVSEICVFFSNENKQFDKVRFLNQINLLSK